MEQFVQNFKHCSQNPDAMAPHRIGIPADRHGWRTSVSHGGVACPRRDGCGGAVPLSRARRGTRVDELPTRLMALFTGSPSNVSRSYRVRPASRAPHDPARDATTLPLIRKAVQSGLPVLGICRGFRNERRFWWHVAPAAPGPRLSRSATTPRSPRGACCPAHDVTREPGGVLHGLSDADHPRELASQPGHRQLGSAWRWRRWPPTG